MAMPVSDDDDEDDDEILSELAVVPKKTDFDCESIISTVFCC
jgi:hypothetical protein